MVDRISLENEVVAELQKGRKVSAIKKLRQLRGMGLKEAKHLVDLYCEQNHLSPSSSGNLGSGFSLSTLIVIVLVCYFAYKLFAS